MNKIGRWTSVVRNTSWLQHIRKLPESRQWYLVTVKERNHERWLHRSLRRGVPGTLRGVAPTPGASSVIRRSPAPPDPTTCTRCTSLTAFRAASPIFPGGRSLSMRDRARRMSLGLSPGGWLSPRCVRSRYEANVGDELEGGGRECDRADSASERREKR